MTTQTRYRVDHLREWDRLLISDLLRPIDTLAASGSVEDALLRARCLHQWAESGCISHDEADKTYEALQLRWLHEQLPTARALAAQGGNSAEEAARQLEALFLWTEI